MLLPSRRRRQRGLAGLLCVNVLGSLAAALPSQGPGVTLSARRARTGGRMGAITRVWLVLTGQSWTVHDHLLVRCRR
ncbi:hypothetical protein FHX69_0025 [Prauserella muralis]|nr:hypothetical protein FHX69_0025 [Prauserella muralis]